jgi:Methyltransferase domain
LVDRSQFDLPATSKVRFGWDKPVHAKLSKIIAAGDQRYAETLKRFLPFIAPLASIGPAATTAIEPHWINDWIPAFDAVSLYGSIAVRNPAIYLEIGSGVSTKFARRAITGHALRTRIVSIDPEPRSEIDTLCDTVIRSRLEDIPPAALPELAAGDVVFFDGTHRVFQNSDVTAFFLDILPDIKPGVLVGVHDIFLPHDYPADWLQRFYSEQYLLACWLLAGNRLKIELPILPCTKTPALHGILNPLWQAPNLRGANHSGGAFWFTVGLGQ